MYYGPLTRRIGNTVRLAQVAQVLAKHGFADLVRRVGLHEALPTKVLVGLRVSDAASDEPETFGRRIRSALTELGPTFIKFGQILSTRPDILGSDICQELGSLQDQVKPLPYEKMAPVIEKSFGQPVEELFAEFDKEPIAAASLSQVYRAKLSSGEDVAVKVQRPNAKEVIESDLNLMEAVAEWINDHVQDLKWMDFPGTVEEFSRSIRRELDFNIEAQIIERFHRNFSGDVRIYVPEVFHDVSNGHVLTMGWVDGVRVDKLDAYGERNSDPKIVARIGCSVLCEQVFEHRYFHADPHPGNIFLMRDNRIAFLDYGMVGHLEHTDVLAMADLLRAVVNEDANTCVRSLLLFTSSGEVEDYDGLVHQVADYITFEASSILSGGQVGKAIDQLMNLLLRNHLQLSPRFSLLLKALATIESTGHALDARMDMTPIVRPYAERIVMSRFKPENILDDVVVNSGVILRMLREMPSDLQNLLRSMRKGRVRVNITHEGLRDFAQVTDRASNRLSFAIIIGSLLIGSSWLIASDAVPQYVSLTGFGIAGVLGLGLAFSILRSRNF